MFYYSKRLSSQGIAAVGGKAQPHSKSAANHGLLRQLTRKAQASARAPITANPEGRRHTITGKGGQGAITNA